MPKAIGSGRRIEPGSGIRRVNGLNGQAASATFIQSDATALDEQVGHLIRRAHLRASAIFNAELGGHRLTTTQYFAMVWLFEMGQLSKNHLAELAALDRPTLQIEVKRLQAQGMVEALQDSHDRRRIVLQLTPAGRAVVEDLQARIDMTNEKVLAPLSPNERDEFLRLLQRLT